jgi:hypothetical protein
MKQKFPGKTFIAVSFESGTIGASTAAVLRSLSAMVCENRVRWHGGSAAARRWIDGEFVEIFAPGAPDWLSMAQADARQAFEGTLRAEGFVVKFLSIPTRPHHAWLELTCHPGDLTHRDWRSVSDPSPETDRSDSFRIRNFSNRMA